MNSFLEHSKKQNQTKPKPKPNQTGPLRAQGESRLEKGEITQTELEALYRGGSWGYLCCQQEEGGGPSYFDERVSLRGLVAIKKNYGDQLERSVKVADSSPFTIHKELRSILGDETTEVTKLGSGDLMVELKSNDQAKKLRAIATFLDIPVTVSPHKSLNSSKGLIRSRDLRCCSDEEMVEELSGVTHARRIKVRRGEDTIQSDTVVLTFDSPKPRSRMRARF
ncbi:RNA-directed DNA polymerase from mobile element jockey [Plakobranchus ocellatus]|uniref:RNA-directed DNA polymerase from mobile element jockey n=1 Tax=Plakobranchus ocellatus TaxID=259542 RepID=A0AAV4CWA1_9GAST|nr:RNA-directed DNA polymerase from mobile element jockey [Plakobranchus ocellatus]